jgi:NodT family efflux transporter outer membrane factor (OMF) lipoprotein
MGRNLPTYWHMRGWLSLGTGLLLSACAVGPDYKRPQIPSAERYTQAPLVPTAATKITAGQAQHFVEGSNIPAQWWTLFRSREINQLVEQCLQNNPDLKAGQATLRAASENVLAQRGVYYPNVSASVAASRQKTAAELQPTPNSGALTFNLFVPQLNVSYDPDVFGLNQRTVESLNAQAEQARYALLATRITLTANVVAAAIQEASIKSQIAATRALIASDGESVKILEDQLKKGYANRLDLAAQQAQLAQANAILPPLLKALSLEHDLVATLVGGTPDKGLPEPALLSALELPTELPVTVPSQLVEQRPDIRQAEENLHSASAQIGVAVANRLPDVTLTGNIGTMALMIGQLFSPGTSAWAIGAGITQPIFDGGQLLHKERAARASFEAAVAQYRSSVLTAFQNVADTLNSLEQDGEALKQNAAAAEAASVTLNLTKQQQQLGYVNEIALLSAEQAYQQAELSLVQAQAARFSDTAALFQALGGGWWNEPSAKIEVPKS